ncbi:MAG: Fe-S cluster assembly protein SufD [Acidimicrobiia bacterium]
MDAARALGGPQWLAHRRAAAAQRFISSALPTPSEEAWRYSRIDELDLDRYRPVAGGDWPETRSEVARAGWVLAVNGAVVHTELDESLEAKGVELRDFATDEEAPEGLGACADSSADAFVHLNDAFTPGGAYIRVPDGVVVEGTIVVEHWNAGTGVASFPRTVVVAGRDSEVSVLERFGSATGEQLVVPVTELVVGDAARLRYLGFQDHGPQVWQLGLLRAVAGRDATVRSSAVALGGDYARLRSEALLAGTGASSEMVAVYFAHESQMLDFRTLQDHDADHTTSDLLFKGAVEDEARSVYSGLIHLRKTASRANAAQTNRNLVLSEGSAALSIPNLEIETDDVKCSHASTVGPIDTDQLYYLESRGVPPEAAERLIVFGFFEDVISRLPLATLQGRLRAAVARKFEARRCCHA